MTVTLSEYATAAAGMPQALEGMAKDRALAAAMDGAPNGPLKPVGPRVSATRHGATGKNARPPVGVAEKLMV